MADLRWGTTNPPKIYWGTTEVKKVYWGTTQVWPTGAPAPSYWDPYIAQTQAVAAYSDLLYVAQMATAADANKPTFVHCVPGGGYYVVELTDDSSFRTALNECYNLGYADMADIMTTEDLEGHFACSFPDDSYFYVFVPISGSGYDTYIQGYRGDAI